MRVRMRLWVLAFAFLALTVAGLAHAEGEKEHWNGPGWYVTCDLSIEVEIDSGPYVDEFTCKMVLPVYDEFCDYFCVYVNADNLKDYGHYY